MAPGSCCPRCSPRRRSGRRRTPAGSRRPAAWRRDGQRWRCRCGSAPDGQSGHGLRSAQQDVARVLHPVEREVVAGRGRIELAPSRRSSPCPRPRTSCPAPGRAPADSASTRVSTRSALTGTTSGVVVAVTSPPFSDHARILKVFGPGVSALNSQVAERLKPGTTLPSVSASGTRGSSWSRRPSRVVCTSSNVTPAGRVSVDLDPRCQVGRGRDRRRHRERGADHRVRRSAEERRHGRGRVAADDDGGHAVAEARSSGH